MRAGLAHAAVPEDEGRVGFYDLEGVRALGWVCHLFDSCCFGVLVPGGRGLCGRVSGDGEGEEEVREGLLIVCGCWSDGEWRMGGG